MGLFDWFRRPRRMPTQFWFDEQSRLEGLVEQVRVQQAKGRHAIVVAHFPAGLVEVGQALAAAGIAFDTIGAWSGREDQRVRQSQPFVACVLATALPELASAPEAAPPTGEPRVAVLACELHVDTQANERVRRFAAGLPVASESRALVSLDSPQVRQFANPRVKSMLGMLGMERDVPIESPMVTRGIERALAKLKKRVRSQHPADSLEEWLARNLAE